MSLQKFLRALAISSAAIGSALPQASLLAAEHGVAIEKPAAAPVTLDVVLSEHGALRGQVVDTQGIAQANQVVALYQQGRPVASAYTDANGRFEVANLRGGGYALIAGEAGGSYRLWTRNAAPATAQQEVLIVTPDQLARGQGRGGVSGGLLMLGVMGGIIAAGVISQDDDSGS